MVVLLLFDLGFGWSVLFVWCVGLFAFCCWGLIVWDLLADVICLNVFDFFGVFLVWCFLYELVLDLVLAVGFELGLFSIGVLGLVVCLW